MSKRLWILGSVIMLGFVVPALLAPWIAPYPPDDMNLMEQLSPPAWPHVLGQDGNGADILSRLMMGARISLYVGFWVVAVSGVIGSLLGLISGYFGGWIDAILMRIIDTLLAFPGLLLAIALAATLGPSLNNVIIALSALGWVSYARLVRAQVLSVKKQRYVLAAVSLGMSHQRIMLRHILPNVMTPIIVQATFSLAGAIIAESSLSFLGLGVPPGTPSWGAMLAEGKDYLIEAPHVSIFPGLAIMLVVLIFNLLGDALRDHWDPKTTNH